MDSHYELLNTIYGIVKNDPHPEWYSCKPRELILRRFQEWPVIQQELELLAGENLVVLEQQDTLVIRITPAGIEKARSGSSLVNG